MNVATSIVVFVFSLVLASLLTPSSQHWHGLFQQHTNYVDGPAFVTQCPIVPGHSFLYDFQALNQAVIDFSCHIVSGLSSVVSCRGRTGTIAISKTSIAMACVVFWSSMTRTILISSFMISITVSMGSAGNTHCAYRLPAESTVITLADW